MMNLGEKLNEEEVAHMMYIVDKDGDGFIDYNEFYSMLMNSIHKFAKWIITTKRIGKF